MNNLDDDKNNMKQLAKIRDAYTSLVDYLKELMFKKRILDSPSYAELSRNFFYKKTEEFDVENDYWILGKDILI